MRGVPEVFMVRDHAVARPDVLHLRADRHHLTDKLRAYGGEAIWCHTSHTIEERFVPVVARQGGDAREHSLRVLRCIGVERWLVGAHEPASHRDAVYRNLHKGHGIPRI